MTSHTENEGQSCNQITRFQKKIIFIITFATTCIILTYITELPHPTLIHTEWDKLKIVFSCVFSVFTYFSICAILGRECKVLCLLFVSLSVALFAYIKHVQTYKCIHIEICTTNLRPFLQTLLIMEVIVHLIIVFVIFVYPNNNVQKNDINTESVINYASMADTEVLIETIV